MFVRSNDQNKKKTEETLYSQNDLQLQPNFEYNSSNDSYYEQEEEEIKIQNDTKIFLHDEINEFDEDQILTKNGNNIIIEPPEFKRKEDIKIVHQKEKIIPANFNDSKTMDQPDKKIQIKQPIEIAYSKKIIKNAPRENADTQVATGSHPLMNGENEEKQFKKENSKVPTAVQKMLLDNRTHHPLNPTKVIEESYMKDDYVIYT